LDEVKFRRKEKEEEERKGGRRGDGFRTSLESSRN
jgi:hypothetical protein